MDSDNKKRVTRRKRKTKDNGADGKDMYDNEDTHTETQGAVTHPENGLASCRWS